eukprot:jgi/Hompol1/3240/HPOL_003187-RA
MLNVRFLNIKELLSITTDDVDKRGTENTCQMTFDGGIVVKLQFSTKQKAQAWTDAVGRVAIKIHKAQQVSETEIIKTLELKPSN